MASCAAERDLRAAGQAAVGQGGAQAQASARCGVGVPSAGTGRPLQWPAREGQQAPPSHFELPQLEQRQAEVCMYQWVLRGVAHSLLIRSHGILVVASPADGNAGRQARMAAAVAKSSSSGWQSNQAALSRRAATASVSIPLSQQSSCHPCQSHMHRRRLQAACSSPEGLIALLPVGLACVCHLASLLGSPL